jgi:nitroreductase
VRAISDLDEVLRTTRSVRLRLDLSRPVERTVIEECLALAFQAPNGANEQSWGWVLVDDPATKEQMAAIYRRGLATHQELSARGELLALTTPAGSDERMGRSVQHLTEHLAEVPMLLVPTIGERYGRDSTFQQASKWGSILPAVWSLMLALRSRGLGAAWTTLHLHHEREMAELLGIPFGVNTQAGLFPIAYTKGLDFRAADRSRSAGRVHWNRWSED